MDKEDADLFGAADGVHGSLRRAGADIENNQLLLVPSPGLDEGGDCPGVAVYESHQRRGLRVAQRGFADRCVKPGQPRLRRHYPARGVAVAAPALTIGAATIKARPRAVIS